MLPSSANSGPLSDIFKARVTSLIQEQLKPIVTELATQQQTLLTHLALLRHNHNVNDYQSTRMEDIRNLEQSINFKVSGVLGFDPWQHPTMGTNLREPVPADPRAAPQFTPIDQATRADRAAKSAALVKEAGTSARQIGVPLTLQDFPDLPAMNNGGKAEDPMHASIPLFGLRDPRWRAMQGLERHKIPGTAAYDGVVARPVGKAGLQLYQSRAKQLRTPMWKLIEEGADPLGVGTASSSPGAGTSHSGVPGVPVDASSFNKTPVAHIPTSSSSSTPPVRRGLHRTYAMANVLDTSASMFNQNPENTSLRRTSTMVNIESLTSTSTEVPTYPSLSRTSTMATIGSTTSEASSLSRASTMATIGSEPPSSRTAAAPTTKSKSKTKQRNTRSKAAAPASASSSSTIHEQPKRVATLKRGRQAAELDDAPDTTATGANNLQPRSEMDREDEDEADPEPAPKRRKSAAAASGTDTTASGQGQQPRRSARVTRASAASGSGASGSRPAPRGRATKGKKGNKRS